MTDPTPEQNGEADEDETFARSVANTVCTLIDDGHDDPHADEIADAYFERHIPSSIKEEVSARLPDICEMVRDTYKNAHLVQITYYETFSDGLPSSINEAEACIPMGAGQHGVGIRVPQVEHDPILLAWIRQNVRAAGGKKKYQIKRLNRAYQAGQISPEDAYEAIRPLLEAQEEVDKFERALREDGALKGPLFAALPEG